MIKTTTTKRVLYADTDKMGYLYYGHYAKLYEIGRAEMLRDHGITYRHLEDVVGVMMPVLHLSCRYRRPALYDDLLTIETSLLERPTKMINLHHKIFNQENELLNKGEVKLFFVDMKTQKRVSCPEYFSEKFDPFF